MHTSAQYVSVVISAINVQLAVSSFATDNELAQIGNRPERRRRSGLRPMDSSPSSAFNETNLCTSVETGPVVGP
jgi:hypothetical protein